MKPLPPVKPPDRLPVTTHLTMVPAPQDPGSQVVVLTQMRGDIVVRRRVVSDVYLSKNEALDEFMRLATRVFYFGEADSLAEG
jgi:hypothetical protein